MTLHIAQHLLDELWRHGEESYPNESCGVLTGKSGKDGTKVYCIVRCENAREGSRHNRYEIAPAELFRIQREAAEEGLEIVGFYHSHPDHPAHWSDTDLEEAFWSGCSYVITGVSRGRAAETRTFLLLGGGEAKRFETEPLLVEGALPEHDARCDPDRARK